MRAGGTGERPAALAGLSRGRWGAARPRLARPQLCRLRVAAHVRRAPLEILTRGAAFNLQSDAAKVAWGKVNGAYIEDLGVFELAADPTDPNEPKLLVGGYKGSILSVADVQKLPIYASKDAGQALFRVAVDFSAAAKLHSGDSIPFSVTKARNLKDDFTGESITIAAGTKAGDVYDLYPRLLAEYMPKHIPGSPNIIVQNIPGAASLIAANQVYNTGKPDGLSLAAIYPALYFDQLLGRKEVQFDWSKFAWIGSTTPAHATGAVCAGQQRLVHP